MSYRDPYIGYEELCMAVFRQAGRDLALQRIGKRYCRGENYRDPLSFLKSDDTVFTQLYPELGGIILRNMASMNKEELTELSRSARSYEE